MKQPAHAHQSKLLIGLGVDIDAGAGVGTGAGINIGLGIRASLGISLGIGIFATLILTSLLPIKQALANMSSNSYLIQYNNVNMTGGKKSSSSYTVTDTVGETGAGRYSSTGYLVRSGFQYIYSIGQFSFSLSNTMINLGQLTVGSFNTEITTLTVSAKGAGGYQVTAYENYPLKKIGTSTTIPDTTCNVGTCNEGAAGIWTSTAVPGFGYNMSGTDIPADFINTTYFKQFADYSNNEAPQIIMSNAGVVKNNQATVTYKAGILGTQAAGNYENNITYIATPGY